MKYRRLAFLITLLTLLVMAWTPVSAQSPTIIQLGVPQFEVEFIYTDDLIARFEAEHPGVQVNLVELNMEDYFSVSNATTVADYFELLGKLAASADVISVENGQLNPIATRARYFLDLSPLVSADGTLNSDDFLPGAWQSFQWDNGIWGLPSSAGIVSIAYDPAAFDAAGLAYPNENWTIDDYANAARLLTTYDEDGNVDVPGFVVYDQAHVNTLFRALTGHGFYDPTTQPETPLFATPELEAIVTTWNELLAEGVVGSVEGPIGESTPPLAIGGSFAYFTMPNQTSTIAASLLPGGHIQLETRGFAISAGTQYPDLAYELAKFLTNAPEVANNFNSVIPARRSLRGVQAPVDDDGPRVVIMGGGALPPAAQAVIDPALETALPASEVRYGKYIQAAIALMNEQNLDAHSALQQTEAQAINDLQTAISQNTVVTVNPPEQETVLAPGEISLNFGMTMFIQPMPNEEQWQAVIDEFVANDPQVGEVVLTGGFGQDTTANDCFYMPYNDVPNADLSTLLNLDPYLNADPSFDPSDVVGNAMAQVQRDNQTWALPISIQPSILRYSTEQFASAGVPEPTSGWTVDAFTDALEMLKSLDSETAPFVPQLGGGSYLLTLIAAYGGLPLDYRTNPPTVDFTSQSSVDAIRQVLDLAKQGYIEYEELAAFGMAIAIGGIDGQTAAIYPEMLNGFGFRFGNGGDNANPYLMTTFPTGSQYTGLAFDMGTAYINASTQNADACYRWISTLAKHPELFSAMPARYSQINDPSLAASQGTDAVATYNQIATLMQHSNTVVFPSLTGGIQQNFLLQYWLNRAFDQYVLEDADLDTVLGQAQEAVTSFQQCVANLPPFDPATGDRIQFDTQVQQCATTADPSLSGMFMPLSQ